MAFVPIRIDRTSKPPLGTPLRSDGHWSVQGNPVVIGYNEGAGATIFDSSGQIAPGSHTGTFKGEGLETNGQQYISLGSPARLAFTEATSFTIISVFKAGVGTDNTDLHLWRNDPGNVSNRHIFLLRRNDSNKINFLIGYFPDYFSQVTGNIDVLSGAICAAAIVRDCSKATQSIFVNGKPDRSGDAYTGSTWAINKASFESRYASGDSSSHFNGTRNIDIFYPSIVLSPPQIKSLSANPWQIYEPETVWIEVGGGEQSLFAGAIYGQSSAFAQLTTAIRIAASAQGTGSTSASLSASTLLTGALQGNAIAQAALSTALELAAQVNGIGSAAGTLGADISGLAGSLHGSSEAQATLATAIHLMGVAAGQCGVVGRLAEPVEILAQLRVMASDPLALRISVRDPLALRVTVQ